MLNYFFSSDSVEQDGSVLLDLRDLSSEDSNDSTVQCDINRCPRLTNDIDKLKDYTIVNKRSDIESSTTSSQLFGSGHTGRSTTNMTSNTNEGLLRSSENSPFTNQLDRTCHASNKQQMGNPFQLNKASLSTSVQVFTEILTNSDENMSPVTARVVEEQLASSHYTPSNNELSNYTSDITPGTSNDVPENDGTVVEENQIQSTNQSSVRTEDYERNSVGDGEVGENQEEEQEHQEVEEDHGEVTQGEVIQAENQEVEEDAEPSQEPAIIGEIYVGHNDNLDDQQLKENIVPFDVMKTIKMVTFDVGQYSMKQNYDIAMKGNNEVKIENGKVIGSTAQNISCVIKDIAIQSMKGQQCF